MNQKTLGRMIASLRRVQGMTQLELAELFGISVDALMQVRRQTPPAAERTNRRETAALALRAVALAMGVAVAALSVLRQIDLYSGFTMLGIGLACAGLSLFQKRDGE